MKAIQMPFQILVTALTAIFIGALLVSGLPWTYILGLLLVFGFAFVFFTNPLYLLGALFLFRAAIDSFLVNIRFSVGGMDLGMGGGFSLLLVALIFMAFLLERDEAFISRLNHPLLKIFAFFCFFLVFNATYTVDKAEALKTILRYLSILFITVMVVMKVKKTGDAEYLLRCIALSFIPSVLIGFISGVSFHQEIRGLRYCATLSHPNILAFYVIVIMSCFLAGLFQIKSQKRAKIFSVVGAILLTMMLLFTKTRGGYAAFVIMLMSYSWFHNRKLLIPMFLICTSLLAFPVVKDSITSLYQVKGETVTLNEESSFAWRLQKWGYLTEQAVKKPIFGHGMKASNYFGEDRLAAHNDYVRFFLESGLVGLALYFAPFVYLFFGSLRIRKTEDKESLLYKTASFFLTFIPPFLIMSISENLASYVIIHWYFWAIAGIFICLQWRSKHAAV